MKGYLAVSDIAYSVKQCRIYQLLTTHSVCLSCYIQHLLKATASDNRCHDPRHSVVPSTTTSHVSTVQH